MRASPLQANRAESVKASRISPSRGVCAVQTHVYRMRGSPMARSPVRSVRSPVRRSPVRTKNEKARSVTRFGFGDTKQRNLQHRGTQVSFEPDALHQFAELASIHFTSATDIFHKMDVKRTGAVSYEDFQQFATDIGYHSGVSQLWDKFNQNRNSVIMLDEFSSVFEDVRPQGARFFNLGLDDTITSEYSSCVGVQCQSFDLLPLVDSLGLGSDTQQKGIECTELLSGDDLMKSTILDASCQDQENTPSQRDGHGHFDENRVFREIVMNRDEADQVLEQPQQVPCALFESPRGKYVNFEKADHVLEQPQKVPCALFQSPGGKYVNFEKESEAKIAAELRSRLVQADHVLEQPQQVPCALLESPGGKYVNFEKASEARALEGTAGDGDGDEDTATLCFLTSSVHVSESGRNDGSRICSPSPMSWNSLKKDDNVVGLEGVSVADISHLEQPCADVSGGGTNHDVAEEVEEEEEEEEEDWRARYDDVKRCLLESDFLNEDENELEEMGERLKKGGTQLTGHHLEVDEDQAVSSGAGTGCEASLFAHIPQSEQPVLLSQEMNDSGISCPQSLITLSTENNEDLGDEEEEDDGNGKGKEGVEPEHDEEGKEVQQDNEEGEKVEVQNMNIEDDNYSENKFEHDQGTEGNRNEEGMSGIAHKQHISTEIVEEGVKQGLNAKLDACEQSIGSIQERNQDDDGEVDSMGIEEVSQGTCTVATSMLTHEEGSGVIAETDPISAKDSKESVCGTAVREVIAKSHNTGVPETVRTSSKVESSEKARMRSRTVSVNLFCGKLKLSKTRQRSLKHALDWLACGVGAVFIFFTSVELAWRLGPEPEFFQ